jgi:enoyl-CoA hydratase
MGAAVDKKEDVLVERDGAVAVVRLNRPDVLNALSYAVMESLVAALEELDRDDGVRCVVLTGDRRAFAAGADIKELEGASVAEMLSNGQMPRWDRLRRVTKPIIAAVSGFALGGGCELAMACDMIVASESAVFGQPEINIGVMPGAGGTQRLTRALGKYLAMDMALTGRRLNAREAQAAGLVSRVFPVESYLDEAKAMASEIAAKPPIAARLVKESVSRALDMSLENGLSYERGLFYSLFATEDQKEGMAAFREKRKPGFKGK